MMQIAKINNKIIKIIPYFFGIIFLTFFGFSAKAQQMDFSSVTKNITLNDSGTIFEIASDANTVNDFLNQQKISLGPNDIVFPDKNAKIFFGADIIIERAKKVIIKEGTNATTVITYQNTIEKVVWENKIKLDQDDMTTPTRNLPVQDGMTIAVTHVLIKQETDDQDIPFQVTTNQDDTLSWRTKKVTQAGQKGVREVQYKVVYNDGKEISRKILQSNVIQAPVNEIDTQGTFVKVGKASTGAASWYSFTGTLAAANPWLPLGSYAKVTNQDNGKSVIVKINDRGPFAKGRIIDLDKVAFQQIADIGAGVANVKMEPILN